MPGNSRKNAVPFEGNGTKEEACPCCAEYLNKDGGNITASYQIYAMEQCENDCGDQNAPKIPQPLKETQQNTPEQKLLCNGYADHQQNHGRGRGSDDRQIADGQDQQRQKIGKISVSCWPDPVQSDEGSSPGADQPRDQQQDIDAHADGCYPGTAGVENRQDVCQAIPDGPKKYHGN